MNIWWAVNIMLGLTGFQNTFCSTNTLQFIYFLIFQHAVFSFHFSLYESEGFRVFLVAKGPDQHTFWGCVWLNVARFLRLRSLRQAAENNNKSVVDWTFWWLMSSQISQWRFSLFKACLWEQELWEIWTQARLLPISPLCHIQIYEIKTETKEQLTKKTAEAVSLHQSESSHPSED